MPVKRKRDILDFDPNKSDSEDENFDPSEARPRRSSKKKSSGFKSKSSSSRRRHARYNGSDIDDDEELSDSEQEDSFEEEEEEDEDEDAPVNAAGRRTRKAAAQHQNYKESSDDSVVEDSDAGADDLEDLPKKSTQRPSKIIILKTKPQNLRPKRGGKEPAPTSNPTRRMTRLRTEEAEEDLVELTTSGRHAQPARSSKSMSPEAAARAARATRGGKGLKKPAATPIEEATQESSAQADAAEVLKAENEENVEPEDVAQEEVVEGDVAENEDVEMEDAEADELQQNAPAEEEEDDDDAPITRRSTRTRGSFAAPAEVEEADDESENGGPKTRRLTRRSGRQQKKSTQEPSSDFEPGDESGDGEASEKGVENNDDDDEYSSPQPRRGRATQAKLRGTKRRRGEDSGEEEIELDKDEMAEELEELRRSSRSRARRRRSPSIVYEEPLSKRRRTAPVDYTIKPLDQLVVEQDDDDDEPAATPARRKGRNGGNTAWERPLVSTFGPFGGTERFGSILGGPWGTGATGGVESDSSDDEMGPRPGPAGLGGTLGMTPTAGTAPGAFPVAGQPFNLEAITGAGATPNVGKIKNQKAFADADPLGVDMSVDFSQVGGLQGHIDQLKEMVQLPLLYPELFAKFHVTPPRGVLFHGPPGTGKTLLARALSNSIGAGGRKITFYMRKGADALSKWVGEAEKQLRLLFEEARKTQPSIIFFDEIDGLAPVRSSKQEQIHASIVSTLLALMDGMDGRGQVIVIGATNRPDNIDPALRRPGRFDREFYFPLPDVEGRRSILDIHTKGWGLSDSFKTGLAENTKGYGGADLRALCTEAALNAIQRTYPQIYSSKEKLIVNPDKITVHATDFMISIKKMVPSSERSAGSGAAPLPKPIEPLLRSQFSSIEKILKDVLPRKKKITALEEAMFEPHDDADHGFGRENMQQDFERARVFRPRLLITGLPDGRPLEQAIVSLFTEVKRHKPSVIYIPNIDAWCATVGSIAVTAFITMLRSIPPTDAVLLLATAECEAKDIPQEVVKDFFGFSKKNRTEINRPNRENRLEYFTNIVTHIRKTPAEFPDPSHRKKRVLEELPIAPPPPPKPRSKAELKAELKKDRQMLNVLKVRLQPIMDQIKRKYRSFRQPVIPYQQIKYLFDEADPNFVRPDLMENQLRPFEIAKDKDGIEGLRETASGKFYYNLEIVTIEERLSNGYYARPMDFYKDIKAMVNDAKNTGDRERIIKANELISNVDVDIAQVENDLGGAAIWDALFERQKERAQRAAEKAKKKSALQSIVDIVQSDLGTGQDSDSQVGPIRVGAPVPTVNTAARFQVMSPLSNGACMANILNDPVSENSSSIRQSGESSASSQHLVVLNDGQVQNFLNDLTERTSGCTIEQLEQINRELMDEIWNTRGEWNRMKVLGELIKVFNETMADIEAMQGFAQSSQEERDFAYAGQYGYR
ncbi:putative atpase family aaa domain-containing protein 2 protein [Phaeoacremonium minimum UCRPA7]|uniref:Putative atpase family aaa domain-containing protein 2 protein n=1 Tax=Phaeoacremonium minimum (strain UCR-PA7) TaxID=1286976 RepID=R8BYI6_PHAM7|nr:putative atpase family aaa domain-containing protein 2 protein [Phaeoacremonium minimum UCRPA7]EOO04407.1 putative atpase family aaa domain-containing protein 2 protein [Phaeoacremonium minimum UCRPA7]